MILRLINIKINNFKGVKNLEVSFSKETNLMGKNATFKSTVHDLVLWVLFGKDAKNRTNHEVRPLGKDGKVIKGAVTVGEVVLKVDQREITLERTYKEKWVQKKGQEEMEFKGHETLFSIDGISCSQTEYTRRISEIVFEEVFKEISNPYYFPNLKWDKQREVLVNISGDVSDGEVIKSCEELSELGDPLERFGLENLVKKLKLEQTKLKKKVEEEEIRLDECKNKLVLMDFKKLEEEKLGILKELEIISLEERERIEKRLVELSVEIGKLLRRISLAEGDKSSSLEGITFYKGEQENLREEWEEFLNRYLEECPYCRSEVSSSSVKEEIYERKFNEINQRGMVLEERIKKLLELFNKSEGVIEKLNLKLSQGGEEWEKLLLGVNNEKEERNHEERTLELLEKLKENDENLKFKTFNEILEKRMEKISEGITLNKKEKARVEKLLILCEKFTKRKISLLEERINSKFSMVKFKLFHEQINGGIVECCECTYKGVPYSSLNLGAQVNCGLDIIKALSSHYNINGFVFIDGRESVNDIIPLDCQVINLVVTLDEELKVLGYDKKNITPLKENTSFTVRKLGF